ncbi:MAG: malto-oligosyltrehalose trehalohydrolase [Gammaproteobacteria bacterium]|nr:malto-oligosyltrehalose trehalohydrolase [Gammaproteobacteria bacterium]
MPFGAEILTDGRARFRLWAPAARQIVLSLEQKRGEVLIPMEHEEEGWFGLTTDRVGPGSHYRFSVGDLRVPDPASRYQPQDVHGPSEVIDPSAFNWSDGHWQGRPWEEAVLYELHVGTFTPEGTFTGVKQHLDYLVDLGVTAIQLMPVADFPGKRNWGYDGVLPFAPDSQYGRPEELKSLIDTAHAKGLMVFLDVVYNHFGPEGNYLHCYSPQFFNDRYSTPWGAAINFDGPHCHTVRDFFIQNVLYWLNEYHIDGLRLDAVHAICDDSDLDILMELAQRVSSRIDPKRHVHLVLENDDNAARYLVRDKHNRPCIYVAQWNDDMHHALHVLATGEEGGYYRDYTDKPVTHLARTLAEGFAYQGDPSPYRGNKPRGEPSAQLPLTAFVSFLQNHDQVGNRAFGERITELAPPEAVKAAMAIILLAPSPPLLFMGEEWAARQAFLFFCNFGPELAPSVRDGRRREFAGFRQFRDPKSRERIPDPNSRGTFANSVLNWEDAEVSPHREQLDFYRTLLGIRAREIFPRLKNLQGNASRYELLSERAIKVHWRLGDGSHLHLVANLGSQRLAHRDLAIRGNLLYETYKDLAKNKRQAALPPWSVVWSLEPLTTT